MKTLLRLLTVAMVIGLVGCKKDNPVSPTVSPPVSPTTPSVPAPPLSISTVAPYLGQTINSVMEQALLQGLTKSGSGRWTYACPAGGDARIDLPDNYRVLTGSEVRLDDTEFVWTDCAMDVNNPSVQGLLSRLFTIIVRPVYAQSPTSRIVARGRLRSKGKWRPPIPSAQGPVYRDAPVQMTGSLEVNQPNCGGGTCSSQLGAIQLDCVINGTVCEGSIGGVGVAQGPPDTPPPPNPTTTTTVTTTVTTTIPPPTPPPGGSVNVSGTWAVSSSYGTGLATLSQSGGSISGSIVGGLPAGATVTSFDGTISGSAVSLTIGLRYVVSTPPFTTECIGTDVFALTVVTSTRMTGTQTSNADCVIAGPAPLPNPPPVPPPTSRAVTWTKQ